MVVKRSSQISLPGSRQVPRRKPWLWSWLPVCSETMTFQVSCLNHAPRCSHSKKLPSRLPTVTGLQRNDDSSGNVAVVAVAATFRGPGPSRTLQGPLGIPRELQGTLKGLSRDLQGRTMDPQGASRDPQGSPRTLQGPPRDAPGDLQGRPRDVTERAPRSSHSDVLRPGTLQGPSGDFPGTLKDP